MNSVVCKHCGSWDQVRSVEHLHGYAGITNLRFVADGSVEFDWEGYTEVDWDTSTTISFFCRGCMASTDTLEELVCSAEEYERRTQSL